MFKVRKVVLIKNPDMSPTLKTQIHRKEKLDRYLTIRLIMMQKKNTQ
jgi:hypothetical protein